MFSDFNSIENINRGFLYENNKLVFCSKNHLFEYDFEKKESKKQKAITENLYGLYKVNEDYIGISGVGYTIYDENFEEKQVNKIKWGIGNFNLIKDKLIIASIDYDNNVFLAKQGVIDVLTNETSWACELGYQIKNYKDYFICTYKSNVKFLISTSGNILWQKDFSFDFPDKNVTYFHGVFEEVLVVALGNDTLIGLNIETGDVIWKQSPTNNNKYVYNENQKLLIGIGPTTYFELDPVTGLLDRFDFTTIQNAEILTSRTNFCLVDNYIITTDSMKGKIGAFNCETHEYDWIHEIEGVSFPAGSPIVYKEPYLFVQDNKNTLHIFEKTTPTIV